MGSSVKPLPRMELQDITPQGEDQHHARKADLLCLAGDFFPITAASALGVFDLSPKNELAATCFDRGGPASVTPPGRRRNSGTVEFFTSDL
jgi:hypothetical protein